MYLNIRKASLILLLCLIVFAIRFSPEISAESDEPDLVTDVVRFAENFDGVQTPMFPSGWTTAVSGSVEDFKTTTIQPDTAPNSAFAASSPNAGATDLISPPILISGVNTVLSFRNRYSLENTWDGAVLEMKVGSGNYEDIIIAGGTFISGGYTTLLNPSTNPLANRFAWSGATQNSFITSSVKLPESTLGQTVQFRWRLGTNNSFAIDGWWIDSVVLKNITTGANIEQISISDLGTALPYPSGIQISGINGLVTDVVVGLENFSHDSPDDVDILLVAPDGRNVVLMSDAGGNAAISNISLTFLDAATQFLPDNSTFGTGLFKPTNYEQLDTFPSPAPQIQSGSSLSTFFGSVPNGTWSLYVVDDNGSNGGAISGGWNLSIKTSTTACLPSITPTAQAFPFSGGNGNFQIGTASGCGWTISTTSSFISIDSPTSGLGNSNVNFSVAANSGAARTGLITITDGFNPRTFQIQQGAGCPSSLSVTTANFPATGQTGSVAVNAGSDCTWQAVSNVSWVEVTSSQQTGNGMATFNVLPNMTRNSRSTNLIVGSRSVTITQVGISAAQFDFDGDSKSDISVYRNGTWYLQQSTNGFSATQFGLATDKIAPADFDGDGKTDIAVFRDGVWYVLQSSNAQFFAVQFGQVNDIPVPADYDGDGHTELAVFRDGIWFTLSLATNQTSVFQFGVANDKPVVADYDADGRADFAVYRDGVWYLRGSNIGFLALPFGQQTDTPIVGDFDGDGKSDLTVYRNGDWHILTNFQIYSVTSFGLPNDLPVVADYDGDGKSDIAVYREGIWYVLGSTQGLAISNFGLAADKPVPNAFVR